MTGWSEAWWPIPDLRIRSLASMLTPPTTWPLINSLIPSKNHLLTLALSLTHAPTCAITYFGPTLTLPHSLTHSLIIHGLLNHSPWPFAHRPLQPAAQPLADSPTHSLPHCSLVHPLTHTLNRSLPLTHPPTNTPTHFQFRQSLAHPWRFRVNAKKQLKDTLLYETQNSLWLYN